MKDFVFNFHALRLEIEHFFNKNRNKIFTIQLMLFEKL